ncbi:hypothetical protein BDW60DRAFT_110580 [Aspergillus nidulans var. acristatus]
MHGKRFTSFSCRPARTPIRPHVVRRTVVPSGDIVDRSLYRGKLCLFSLVILLFLLWIRMYAQRGKGRMIYCIDYTNVAY